MNVTSDPSLEHAAAPAGAGIWPLDPNIIFLNHGSFGSCPEPVLEYQRELRSRLERQPVQFFVRELEGLWDQAREFLAGFIGAQPEDLVFVPNATAGINTILRSIQFKPGDEVLVTDHEYNACRNALDEAAARSGARVTVAAVPFPVHHPDDVIQAIEGHVTTRTRLALMDHVTSQTGLVLPIARIVQTLAARGVDVLVDGAHAPGMLPLDLTAINAAYYTGNCHKWICAPKGAAFLHVRRDRQTDIRPLVISHGANSPRTDRSRFLLEFGWMGTGDPSAALSVPEAIRFVGSLVPGGWPEIQQRNRRLALAGRLIVAEALEVKLPAPDEMIGSLASLPLPDSVAGPPPRSPLYLDPLQDELLGQYRIEIPVIPWPAPPKRLIRISAQLYNALPQYRKLATALRELLQS